jgi:hypothetical protein
MSLFIILNLFMLEIYIIEFILSNPFKFLSIVENKSSNV